MKHDVIGHSEVGEYFDTTWVLRHRNGASLPLCIGGGGMKSFATTEELV